jgi:hypothetical protein
MCGITHCSRHKQWSKLNLAGMPLHHHSARTLLENDGVSIVSDLAVILFFSMSEYPSRFARTPPPLYEHPPQYTGNLDLSSSPPIRQLRPITPDGAGTMVQPGACTYIYSLRPGGPDNFKDRRHSFDPHNTHTLSSPDFPPNLSIPSSFRRISLPAITSWRTSFLMIPLRSFHCLMMAWLVLCPTRLARWRRTSFLPIPR